MQGEQQLQLFEMDEESIPGFNPISKGCGFLLTGSPRPARMKKMTVTHGQLASLCNKRHARQPRLPGAGWR